MDDPDVHLVADQGLLQRPAPLVWNDAEVDTGYALHRFGHQEVRVRSAGGSGRERAGISFGNL